MYLFVLMLSLLLLVLVISLSLLFSTYSSSYRMDTVTLSSMLPNTLLLTFLDSYNISLLSLRYKALSIVINFYVFWAICLSFSLVYFKNGPNYLTRETTQLFIALMRFLLQALVSRSFLVRLSYFFLVFFFFHFYLFVDIRFQYHQIFVIFLFSIHPDFFWFGCSIPSIICPVPLFIMNTAYFSCRILFQYSGCIQFFFTFRRQVDVVHVHKVITFFLRFGKFIVPNAFLKCVIQ